VSSHESSAAEANIRRQLREMAAESTKSPCGCKETQPAQDVAPPVRLRLAELQLLRARTMAAVRDLDLQIFRLKQQRDDRGL
jgi:hypothetical protein